MGKRKKESLESHSLNSSPTDPESPRYDDEENLHMPYEPLDIITISNLEHAALLNHEKKRLLLELLLHSEKTIMELSTATKMNPGTIKRHLDTLEEGNFIVKSREERNEYGIKLKYYRVKAKLFLIQSQWPPKTE